MDDLARPLRLLQLTDLHLFGDPGGCLLGQNTRDTFEAVLALAMQGHWPPDALVLTGDLVHDEHVDGYLFLQRRIQQLNVPFFCIPGNHDSIELMARYLDPRAAARLQVHALAGWDLLLIDSTIPARDDGRVEPGTLLALHDVLAADTTRPALVFLHHHPLPVQSRWIDTMLAENGDSLLDLVARHPRVRGVLWGHIHQDYRGRIGETELLATPSTSVQFLPHCDSFALDPLCPGYRWLTLYPDGGLETGIERIRSYPAPLPARTEGY
jgi:Icc protein